MPADILLEINPPVGLDWRWWAVAGALALVAVAVMAVGILRWRVLGRGTDGSPEMSLTTLRSDALARVSEATAAYHSGGINAQNAVQQMSRATRWFAGTASDGDADYETAAQLSVAARRDPRLLDVATFVTSIQADCFSPTARPDVDAVAASAEEVIHAWR